MPTPGPQSAPSMTPVVTSPAAPVSTREYLAKPRTFTVAKSSTAEVTATRTYTGSVVTTATLPLTGGTITVRALDDGTLAISALELDLGNFALDASSLPPEGIDLMGVKLTLRDEADITADWSGDASAMNASARTDLLLNWSLSTSGGAVPLATEQIANVPFELAVNPDQDGKISLDFHASRDGVFWDWTGLIALSDLKLDLEATP